LTTFAASFAGAGRIGEQRRNAGIRGPVCHELPGSRPTPKRRKLDKQFSRCGPSIFAAFATAIRGHGLETGECDPLGGSVQIAQSATSRD
jgi:hypothetical protein